MKSVFRSSILVLSLAALASGCGGESRMVSESDPRGISDLMDTWNDAKMSLKAAEKCFVAGGAPAKAEFKKYGKYSYSLTSKANESSTTATVPVAIYDESGGKDAGKKDWTFVKEAEGWKIKSAPLP